MTEFAYNNVMHFFIKIILFFTLYEQHSHMLLDAENNISRKKINTANQQETNSAANQHLKKLQKMQNQLKKHL